MQVKEAEKIEQVEPHLPETNRGRVRRLLIDPLIRDGLRHNSREKTDDAHQRFLDGLCDDLAYLPDARLEALRRWVEVNGRGSRKCFWPARIEILTVVQAICPRPVEELPELVSWMESRAGVAAAADHGRLVAEYRFITKNRRPPVTPREQQVIGMTARGLVSDVTLWRERRDGGRVYDADALAEFESDENNALAIVRRGEQKRQAEQSGAGE